MPPRLYVAKAYATVRSSWRHIRAFPRVMDQLHICHAEFWASQSAQLTEPRGYCLAGFPFCFQTWVSKERLGLGHPK